MFARVSRYRGDVAQMRDGFEAVTGELEGLDGFARAYFLADGEHERAISITLWETEQAMQASAERAHQMRARATEPAQATVEAVEGYEVILTVESRATAG